MYKREIQATYKLKHLLSTYIHLLPIFQNFVYIRIYFKLS